MLWADASSPFRQSLDPLQGIVPGSAILSTLAAALPVLTLFYLLVPRRWMASKAGAAGAVVAIVVAVLVFRMPVDKAIWSFAMGAAFGLLPVGWTIFSAMLLYNMTVETGHFSIIRRSIAGLSGDARIQALLIGFSFGAFLEGAAGGGTPVAICGAIMVGLGFHPFLAAVLCLIANTSPVAFGGLGTPILILGNVTGIAPESLSVMAGHQLPLVSFFIPLWMVRCMCSWKQTWEIWPALLVCGGSFALFQYFFATFHTWVPGVVLYQMTDIGGGIFSMVLMAVFLQFWKPRKDWHFTPLEQPTPEEIATELDPFDPHAAEAASLARPPVVPEDTRPLTVGRVVLAWMPFVLMSIFLMLGGLVRQMEQHPGRDGVLVPFTNIHTNYKIKVPTLHLQTSRDPKLTGGKEELEAALYDFAWVTSPGSPVFAAALVTIFLLRMNLRQLWRVIVRTFVQMKIPIPTIAFMLGLSYVTRYAGMDSTLGYAFSGTGLAYPFFAAVLGWIGVFLTGTDAGSNALFGSLQQITANLLHSSGAFGASGLSQGQAQVLICTANSTGGVMGKMIDAQSICVATAATHQLGKEADIFKAVLKHSMILVAIIGAITLLQAYVPPFTQMVPEPAAKQTP